MPSASSCNAGKYASTVKRLVISKSQEEQNARNLRPRTCELRERAEQNIKTLEVRNGKQSIKMLDICASRKRFRRQVCATLQRATDASCFLRAHGQGAQEKCRGEYLLARKRNKRMSFQKSASRMVQRRATHRLISFGPVAPQSKALED